MDCNFIGLWRNKMPSISKGENDNQYPLNIIFPSGRQALSYGLMKVGLSRPNRVAIPEWSSHCVISSVGKYATPISITEIIKYGINVDAVLFYEQWGWPIRSELKSEIEKRFENKIIILDRVDSADIENNNRIKFYPNAVQLDLISLSKILGLPGGGLIKLNSKFLTFEPNLIDQIINSIIWKNKFNQAQYQKLLRINMNDLESLHPELVKWLKENSLFKTLENEYEDRKCNLKNIIESELSSNWPEWMFDAYKNGVGPSIVPLLKNEPIKKLSLTNESLMKTFGIETSIYHFDWSGNPLNSNYQNVLAFPIHGMIKEFISNLIKEIIRIIK